MILYLARYIYFVTERIYPCGARDYSFVKVRLPFYVYVRYHHVAKKSFIHAKHLHVDDSIAVRGKQTRTGCEYPNFAQATSFKIRKHPLSTFSCLSLSPRQQLQKRTNNSPYLT